MDGLVVCLTFLLAYYIRFYLELFAIKNVPVADVVTYIKGALVLAGLWIFFIWRDGGYVSDLRGVHSLMVRYRSVLHSGLYAMVALMSISFLYREFLLSRQVYLMTGVLVCSGMALGRVFFHRLDKRLALKGFVAQRVVLLGDDEPVQIVAERIQRHGTTVKVIGVIGWDHEHEPSAGEDVSPGPMNYQRLGIQQDIESIYGAAPFDAIIVCPPENGHQRGQLRPVVVLSLVNFCEKNGIAAFLSPGSYDIAVTQQEVGSLSGVPLIRIQDATIDPLNAVLKRLFDLALAPLLLLGSLPLMLLLALIIKLTSKGPIFFQQVRAGLHGKPFIMYKFRSMVLDAERQLAQLVDIAALPEPVFKIAHDPRTTRIGRWMRRTGLDELPQLLNVLKGEMSLVGPRPEEMAMVEKYDILQRRRLKALPGITGYQQIMNRGATSLAERIKYDLIYLKYQSLFFDIYILLRTVDVVLRGKGITH
jgi:exopolysaccharide biosynthesis polyprenyl glycosylphosphotransferase